MKKNFEMVGHTGDLKFKAYGENPEDLFNHCALALSYIFSRGKKIPATNRKEFNVSGEDYEALLYNFLEELIYLFDTKQFLVSKTEISINRGDDYELKVVAYGDSTLKHKDLDAIKSPTYSEMYFKKIDDEHWEAQIVLDV
jgi:SHS2 domain-containing protein